MKFQSTRGGVSGLSFEDAIFKGFASDGGLLMPEVIPEVDLETLEKWRDLCYVDLCVEILSLFIGEAEISKNQLRGIIIINNNVSSYIAHFTDVSMRFTISGGLVRAGYIWYCIQLLFSRDVIKKLKSKLFISQNCLLDILFISL